MNDLHQEDLTTDWLYYSWVPLVSECVCVCVCRCMHLGCVCTCFCAHRGRNSHEVCATNSQPFNVSGSLLVGFQEGLLFWVGGIPICHGSYASFPPRFMLHTLTMNCSSLASVLSLLAGLSLTLCGDINVHISVDLERRWAFWGCLELSVQHFPLFPRTWEINIYPLSHSLKSLCSHMLRSASSKL